VIVSHPDRARRKEVVEVLMCSTQRAGRPAQAHEIILDPADGLDWPTLCRCDLIHSAFRDELKTPKGKITPARQRQMVRTLIESHGWAAVL
jgi:hypothetical protein